MNELVNELTQQYANGEITWHDIQDITLAYVIKQDSHKGIVPIEVTRDRIHKQDVILKEIEKRMEVK